MVVAGSNPRDWPGLKRLVKCTQPVAEGRALAGRRMGSEGERFRHEIDIVVLGRSAGRKELKTTVNSCGVRRKRAK